MKIFITTFIVLSSCLPTLWAQLTPERGQIYHCLPQTPHEAVEGAKIYQSNFGRNEFYEIEVEVLENGIRSSYFKKVHLNSTYGGRILTFGTGNFRIKVDHVFPTRGKFKAFARIPRYNIHSKDWSCKKS